MAYRKGDLIRRDHVLTERGEFRAVARDYGFWVALDCWCNTHDVLSMTLKCAVGFALGSGVVIAVVWAMSGAGLL